MCAEGRNTLVHEGGCTTRMPDSPGVDLRGSSGMRAERPSPEILTRNLKTTSDKIRTLAKEGYSRIEIAKLLSIRYQHVRKVLVDAGITDGLRLQREIPHLPTPVDAAPSPRIPPELLLQAGFRSIGEWTRTDAGSIALKGNPPTNPGVYAFVLDDFVVYVGLALRGVANRMRDYRRGDKRQKTSARINSRIKATVESGQSVKVLVAAPGPGEWNGLPVSTAAGLEVGLIQAIRPKWNIQVGTRAKT